MQNFFKNRKIRKEFKHLAKYAEATLKMQSDVAGEQAAAKLREVLADARRRVKAAHGLDVIAAAREALFDEINPERSVWRPLHKHGFAENFEVLLVAVAVAMSFRCYFFQPFKIPTGSMQPTLYGIHATDRLSPQALDNSAVKIFKWVITGQWYKKISVRRGGRVVYMPSQIKPGYNSYRIAGDVYHVPTDAVKQSFDQRNYCLVHEIHGKKYLFPFDPKTGTLRPSTKSCKGGDILWQGVIHAGDHVFVNRIYWNFRKPQRGEVMVFSTRDIKGLPEGTHYIKRLTGLPGEKIEIDPPYFKINGEKMTQPRSINLIAKKQKLAEWAPPYAGYQVIGNSAAQPKTSICKPLRTPSDSFDIPEDFYYGMGDNTSSSNDSRYWGAIPAKNLLGLGAIVYWPFTSPRWGTIK